MTSETPVHDLQKALAAVRLRAVEELAAKGGTFSPDDLQKLATLQFPAARRRRSSPRLFPPNIRRSPNCGLGDRFKQSVGP